ncbi:MAG: hypothetical protein AAGA03_15670 [Planctomycetota bacterium]
MLFSICVLLCIVFITVMNCASADLPSKDRWPPISEDEFIRRCSPGVDRERALKVRRIIAEQLGVDYERVYPEQRFVEDLGC